MRSFLPRTLPALAALSLVACSAAPRAAIHEGHVILQEKSQKAIYSIDVRTGRTLATMPPEGWANAPVSQGDIVFFHGAGGLVARDMNTGEARWRLFVNLPDWWPIAASKGAVFVPQFVGTNLLARGDVITAPRSSYPAQMSWVGFDVEKGTKLYELRSDTWAPLAANDDVAVTFENRELVGYSVADGKERWRSTIPVKGPILVEGGHVFARSEDKLAVFSTSSGALQRTIHLGGTDAFSCTADRLAPKGNVVAWIEGHVVHVADLASGKEAWRKDGADKVAATATTVVVSRGEELHAFDLGTGSLKWKLPLDDDPSSLAADGDAVVARVDGSRAVVVDVTSGKQRFVFDARSGTSTPPKR